VGLDGRRVTTLDLPTLSDAAVDALREAVGDDGVIIDRAGIDEFRDPYWVPGDDTYAASAVVQPTSTEQVQAIMRVANRFGVPVWPHSQGRNNGYGGPSPRVRGSIQIGFRKMDRVLEINEELAYAVVEPGVRWMDLWEAIEAGGHSLMLSVPDIGWGSVIGNAMDSGATYMPYGSDFMSPCGMEVVLPDGDVLRTGTGGIPDSSSWHVYRRGMGPVLDPLFVQSNYGIVTKMGVWLRPKPEAYIPMTLTAPRDADLEAVVDTLRRLRLDGVLEGVPAIYAAVRASSLGIDGPVKPPRLLSDEEIQAIADETGLGRWTVRAAIWGTSAIAEQRLAAIREAWGRIDGSQVIAENVYAPEDYPRIELAPEKIQAGIPTMQLIERTPPNLGHIGFSPIVPLTGGHVRRVIDHIRGRLADVGINYSGGIFAINERSCLAVTGIQFDVNDTERVRTAFDVSKRMVAELGSMGYGEYRAHLDFMDLASEQYRFNDHAYRRFVSRIKDAIDPNGVLSPGRHGVWPSGGGAGAG
jgi:4-cresol dehydrogenase (hydroxylating) flavoprotein subunit